MARKKPSERLLERLRTELELDLPEDVYIKRTYAGWWMRDAGAFSWLVEGTRTLGRIGSPYRVTDLLRCPKLAAIYDKWQDCTIVPGAPDAPQTKGTVMAWKPGPEVAVARDAARKLGDADQIIILYVNYRNETLGCVTYGKTKALCDEAKGYGAICYDKLRQVMEKDA